MTPKLIDHGVQPPNRHRYSPLGRSFYIYRLDCPCGTHVVARYRQSVARKRCDGCGRTLHDDRFELIGIQNAHTKEQAIEAAVTTNQRSGIRAQTARAGLYAANRRGGV